MDEVGDTAHTGEKLELLSIDDAWAAESHQHSEIRIKVTEPQEPADDEQLEKLRDLCEYDELSYSGMVHSRVYCDYDSLMSFCNARCG